MLSNLGFYLTFLSCIAAVYGTLASLLAAYWQHRRLYRSARMALTACCALLIGAAGLLIFLFYQRDFSNLYVFKNSSIDLPAIYTLTAYWSSLEGSHNLWTVFLAICATLALWSHSQDNEHMMPYVSASLQSVVAWMCYLSITHSDPFLMQLPMADNGKGMNALLQNPYMAIHPPLLFIGYTTLAIPFAYGMGALGFGDITEGWLRTVRRWTLVAWCFLTVAITLGGRWAYVELGWAGYWAWDPVENSSFMPWLLATALLHSLLVQDKIGHLKRLSIVLAILAFFMTFMGTFITRSGVITSVHSFAESPIGPSYLLFLGVLLGFCALVYAVRAPSILPPDTDKVWGFSKESALVITQFLILSFAAIIFIGTLFPIISEWVTGQKITIQAPYFNAFSPIVGLGFIIGIAIGNLMHYRSDKIPEGRSIILGSTIWAIPIAAVFIYFGDVFQTPSTLGLWMQIVGMYLSAWSISCLSWSLYLRLKQVRFKFSTLMRFDAAYVGSYLAHVGLLFLIIGFLGNLRGVEKTVTLTSGESAEVYGYNFKFGSRIEVEQNANATAYAAPLQLLRNGRVIDQLRPSQRRYPTSPETTNEIAVRSRFWYDIYVVLAGFDKATGGSVTLKININPTVRLVWYAIALMALGGIVCLFDNRRGQRSKDVLTGASWDVA